MPVAWPAAIAVVLARGKKRAEHAVLHVKHRHVLVDRDVEPCRWRGLQQRLELGKIEIIARRHPLEPVTPDEIVRRPWIGDIQRKVPALSLARKERQVIVI